MPGHSWRNRPGHAGAISYLPGDANAMLNPALSSFYPVVQSPPGQLGTAEGQDSREKKECKAREMLTTGVGRGWRCGGLGEAAAPHRASRAAHSGGPVPSLRAPGGPCRTPSSLGARPFGVCQAVHAAGDVAAEQHRPVGQLLHVHRPACTGRGAGRVSACGQARGSRSRARAACSLDALALSAMPLQLASPTSPVRNPHTSGSYADTWPWASKATRTRR